MPEGEPSTEPLAVSFQDVYEAIRGFKPSSAPCPSGLRGEHLKEMGLAALGQVTRLVNGIAAGRMPANVTFYFCGSNLFAAKKSGGLRPVALDGILRRLTSKCLAYKVAGGAAALLKPLQFGVGVRGGCEAVVHATRATLTDATILQPVPQGALSSLRMDAWTPSTSREGSVMESTGKSWEVRLFFFVLGKN